MWRKHQLQIPSNLSRRYIWLDSWCIIWLIHFFSPTPALSTICRPLSIHMCSIIPETAKVGSSYSHLPLCCQLTLTFTLTSDNLLLCITLLFRWLYNYAPNAADILTPPTVEQGVSNHSWGLYCRRCYCICIGWGRSSRIFHLSRWFGQLRTVLTKDDSPYTGDLYTLGGVFYSPKHRALGRRDFDFLSYPKDDGESWEWNRGRTVWQV